MDRGHWEIERKFLIARPEQRFLDGLEAWELRQTYLVSGEAGLSERVRQSRCRESCVYTHTTKRRVSGIRAVEQEQEISRACYETLLERADPGCRTIEKTRYHFCYAAQHFELDVYPFWHDRAILELELREEEQEIRFPLELLIIKEVTWDKRYKNHAMARTIPWDELAASIEGKDEER